MFLGFYRGQVLVVLRLFFKFPFFFLMHHFTDFLFTNSLVFGFIMLVIFAWLFLFSGCLVSGLVLGLVGLVFTVAFGVFWFLGGHFNTWNAFFLVWTHTERHTQRETHTQRHTQEDTQRNESERHSE